MFLCPWDSPGKNTGVGCHALLQGIFPTWGLNPCLPVSPALQVDSLPTELPGKPICVLKSSQTCKQFSSIIQFQVSMAIICVTVYAR